MGKGRPDERRMASGADHLYYALADEIIFGYLHSVEAIDEDIDGFEDAVFARPTPDTLEQVFCLNAPCSTCGASSAPQREVLNKLARDDYAVIDAEGPHLLSRCLRSPGPAARHQREHARPGRRARWTPICRSSTTA